MLLKTEIFKVNELGLVDLVKQTVSNYLKESELGKTSNVNSRKKFVTANEVCDLLSISKSTLWRWSNQGLINKIYLNGLPRYRSSEIEELAEGKEVKGE